MFSFLAYYVGCVSLYWPVLGKRFITVSDDMFIVYICM